MTQPRIPSSVLIAVGLYCTGLIASPVIGWLDPRPAPATSPELEAAARAGLIFGIALGAVIFLLIAVLLYKIYWRRHWARVALLIVTALGIVAYAPEFLDSITSAPLIAALDTIVIVLEVIAVILLFMPPSNRWFKTDSGSATDAA
jgi:hypothetical protein